MSQALKLTVLMPCLNEAETLARCIQKAHTGAQASRAAESYEIVVADNGSTDGSQDIARANGARVVDIPIRGYGAALQGGVKAAYGEYVIMADSDDSYDFSVLEPFLEKLDAGYDLVMGTRIKGHIMPGAMPRLHQYLGNPVLTFIGNLFFKVRLSDFHCGMRAFRRDAMLALNLRTTGMEYASEMVISAALNDMKRTEIPITLYPDGRTRPPHLRTWRDGWRHLRFMLLYSPRWLFLYPGLLLMAFGGLISLPLFFAPLQLGAVTLDVHTLLITATLTVIGVQLVFLAVFARTYAARIGVLPPNPRLEVILERFTLGSGLMLGAALMLSGFLVYAVSFFSWSSTGFAPIFDYQPTLRAVILGTLVLLSGISVFFNSFVISLLTIKSQRPE